MSQFRFWIVNANAALAAKWDGALRRESWAVARAADLAALSESAAANGLGIALVDWPVLGGQPIAALKAFKGKHPGIAIILTSHADIANDRIIETLEAGVDDFFPHAIDENLLRAKLRAHLRRLLPSFATAMNVLRSPSGDIKLDRTTWELSVKDKAGKWTALTSLTRTEMQLLALFLERPGTAMERGFIVDTVWQAEADTIRPGTVDKHVESLRKKLGKLGGRIQTVYGVGYAFREEP